MLPYLDELLALHLPKDTWAIFGSGPLAIRGLRDASDIDIAMLPNAWAELKKEYPHDINEKGDGIMLGNIAIYNNWPCYSEQEYIDIIKDAEYIDDFPFVKLPEVLHWKEHRGREKDVRDIELIKRYLANHIA